VGPQSLDAAATPSLRHRVAGVAVGPAVAGAGTRHLPPSPDTCPTVVFGEGRVCEGANVGVCQSVTTHKYSSSSSSDGLRYLSVFAQLSLAACWHSGNLHYTVGSLVKVTVTVTEFHS